MNIKSTLDLREAADFLGFKGLQHLREKAKAGLIPGAFKVGNRWMFHFEEIDNWVRNFYKNLSVPDITVKRSETWQLVKRKTARTITQGFQSQELECRNRLDALQKEMRKNMKRKEEKR